MKLSVLILALTLSRPSHVLYKRIAKVVVHRPRAGSFLLGMVDFSKQPARPVGSILKNNLIFFDVCALFAMLRLVIFLRAGRFFKTAGPNGRQIF